MMKEKKEYIKKLNYKIRKNFVTDSTEFYNLSYQYLTDCLTAAIEFNRSYYLDKDVEEEGRQN